ncbi:MAG: Gx transporter family protein [Thiobacillaceae bacterium]
MHAESKTISLHVSAEDRRIAHYAALAIGLSLAEAALPSPIPGIKPGLANIVVLWVLLRHGWRTAAWVALIRVFAGSLLLGTFLAPGFWLSLSGSVASLLSLLIALRLPRTWFGPVSHSLIAANFHIAGQLLLAAIWLMPGSAILGLTPLFAFAALLFGTANGLVVARLISPDAQSGAQSVRA